MRILLTAILGIIYTSVATPSFLAVPSDIPAVYDTRIEAKTSLRGNERAKNGNEKPIWDRELETREDVKEYIRWSAEFMEIDPDFAIDLARIESNFESHAKNPNSSAQGIYQFVDGTWKKYCQSESYRPEKTDIKANVQCAHRLIYAGELNHWLGSEPTKQKLIHLGYSF